MAQASDLQAKLLLSYLATVKTIKRGAQSPPWCLTPLSSYLSFLSLLSPLPFLFVFSPHFSSLWNCYSSSMSTKRVPFSAHSSWLYSSSYSEKTLPPPHTLPFKQSENPDNAFLNSTFFFPSPTQVWQCLSCLMTRSLSLSLSLSLSFLCVALDVLLVTM
jgi:hypothetical protein